MRNFFTSSKTHHKALFSAALCLISFVLASDVVYFQDTFVTGATLGALSTKSHYRCGPVVGLRSYTDGCGFTCQAVLRPTIVFSSPSWSDGNSVLDKDTAHGECAGAVEFGDLDRPFGLIEFNNFGISKFRFFVHINRI